MIPIRDTIRSRHFPAVTWLLIIANVLVFLFENALGQNGLERLITDFGLVPARLALTNVFTWYPIFTSMFLHGGWFHLISNMWFLFIFGDNVEDHMGSWRFLSFYLVGGMIAGLLQSVLVINPNLPSVGASGAIAAVLGAYIFFYPRSRIVTLIFLFLFPWFVQIPALIYLGVWFVSQLFSGLLSLSATQSMNWGGVAWWAHIGGFLFGLLIAAVFGAPHPPDRWVPQEYESY